jgi:probable F420-dependent oxidoreductase
MRLAISVGVDDVRAWPTLARDVEAMGFHVLHLADHLVDRLPPPATGLLAAAEATDHLVLGNLVLAVDFRHPAVLAREAAMLADLSGGRYGLGIGAGHAKAEWDAVGLPFDPPAARVARLEEAVVVVRRLLDGEEVTFDGEHYRLDGHRCWPVPTTPVPILVGGNGDRVLRIAGRHGDIVGLTGFGLGPDGRPALTHFTAAGLAERLAHVHAAAAGRMQRLRVQVLVQRVVVTPDRRAAAEAIATELSGALDVGQVLESPFVLLGTAAQIADQVRERSARYGVETWTVFGDLPGVDQPLRSLAPVAELLRG